MSRIGNQSITLPSGVSIEISEANVVSIKGPKGTLTCDVNNDIKVVNKDNIVTLSRPSDQPNHKAMHGLYRALLNNNIIGVHSGFKKSLELVGVGYKANTEANYLELHLGYSHVIFFAYPKEVKVTTELAKGKNPVIHIEGIDKQLVGQVAAKIRSLRKPEPYKGKGVKFVGEVLRRKAGKTGGK